MYIVNNNEDTHYSSVAKSIENLTMLHSGNRSSVVNLLTENTEHLATNNTQSTKLR